MGSVASFKTRQESCRRGTHLWFLGGQPEQLSDEPDLTTNIIAPQTDRTHTTRIRPREHAERGIKPSAPKKSGMGPKPAFRIHTPALFRHRQALPQAWAYRASER